MTTPALTAEAESLLDDIELDIRLGTEFVEREVRSRLAAIEAAARAPLREALVAAIERLPMFDESDRITAMNGTVRSPRTPADYVEGYRNRVLAIIQGGSTASQKA